MTKIYILDTNIIIQKGKINRIIKNYDEKGLKIAFLNDFKTIIKEEPNVFITPIIMSEIISQVNFPIDNYKKHFWNKKEDFLSNADLNKYKRITREILARYEKRMKKYVHKDLRKFNSFALFMKEDASLFQSKVKHIKDLLIAKELKFLSKSFQVFFVTNNKKDFHKNFKGNVMLYSEFLKRDQFKSKKIKFVQFKEFILSQINNHFFQWEIEVMQEEMYDDFFFHELQDKYYLKYYYENVEYEISVNSEDIVEYKGDVSDVIDKIIKLKQEFIKYMVQDWEDQMAEFKEDEI